MGLKDQIRSDLDIIFNLDEFAEPHKIDSRILNIIVDNDRLMQRSQKEYDGIGVGEILYYVKASNFGERPAQGAPQIFDGRQMFVFDSREVDGIYEIILQQYRSG